jgi:T-complex protein 1 subunit delta
VNLIYP